MTNSRAMFEHLYKAAENLHKYFCDAELRNGYLVVVLQKDENEFHMKRISPKAIEWPVMCFGEQEFYLETADSMETDRYWLQQPSWMEKPLRLSLLRYSNGKQTFWMAKHHLWMLEPFTVPSYETNNS